MLSRTKSFTWKFDEMPKSPKIVFTVWPMGKADWVVGGVKYAPEPKLLVNLMKCLNPLNIFFTLWHIEEGGWVVEGVKCASWTKVAEIC